jgi:hypothetical protein
MRTAASLVLLVQAFVLLPLFLIYGQVDPCRALAKEISWRADAAGGLGVTLTRTFGDLEIDARRDVAEYSTSECIGKLVTSWSERVTGGSSN